MEMTQSIKRDEDPYDIAQQLRNRVEKELGFTVNIGVSSNKLLAKMASDFTKPNKVHTLFPHEIQEKMWPLPVGDLFYVGPSTEKKLRKFDIRTIGQLANMELNLVKQILGHHGSTIWNFANGRDFSEITHHSPVNKGYGNSTTTREDVVDIKGARKVLLYLSESVGGRLRKDNMKVTVVALSIKYHDFTVVSRQMSLTGPTNITAEIFTDAMKLFVQLWDHKTPIRHLGIRTSHAKEDTGFKQMSLFTFNEKGTYDINKDKQEKQQKADQMVDEIRRLHGKDAIKRAIFAEE